jgi:hypothetical protein
MDGAAKRQLPFRLFQLLELCGDQLSLAGETATYVIQRNVVNVADTPLFPPLALVDLSLGDEGMNFRAHEGPGNGVLKSPPVP